ncbi:MAG: hypothetical protein HKN13_09370, partial [Rhodothermales bacterium]|nr:hypothetical protein [Rhodothermales bacterium]
MQKTTTQHLLIDSPSSSNRPTVSRTLRPSSWEQRNGNRRTEVDSPTGQDVVRQQHSSQLNVVAASLILLMVAPVLFVIAVLIKLSSRGPVFYTQDRMGLHGKPFKLYK